MTGMLGAELGGLGALAERFSTTTGAIGEVQAQAQTVAADVISALEETFSAAIQAITGTMDHLAQNVSTAVSEAEGTAWTGANRETFMTASGDFASTMEAVRSATNEMYVSFNEQAAVIGGLVEQYQGELSTNLTNAATSTEQMGKAVTDQQTILDETMNTGLSLG